MGGCMEEGTRASALLAVAAWCASPHLRPSPSPPCLVPPSPSPSLSFSPLQLIIILDFVFAANEWLLEREGCAWALVTSTALL